MKLKLNQVDPSIFTIQNVYSHQECKDLIQRAEQIGFDSASVRTRSGPQMMPKIRNNCRVNLNDPQLANQMWERIKDLLPSIDSQNAVGVDLNLRFYRYEPGQQFRRHIDGSVTNELNQTSQLSYLIYLNDNFTGGSTIFRDYQGQGTTRKKIVNEIIPKEGSALLFRHARWHEGSEVTEGQKYVLRTDVFYAS